MSRLRAAAAALMLSCTLGTAVAEAATVPVWTATGPIVAERYSASGVALPDGGALLIGGRPSGGQPMASVERFNPATGRWLLTSSLLQARNSASAITLPDGRVLVAGGEPQPIVYHDSTELYDPVTGVWSAGARMRAPRADFATVLLADGRVLAVGGYHYAAADGAEIYDPAKNEWTLTSAPSVARANPAVARLRDGRVLVAGGWSYAGTYLDTAELYDPATDTWTPLPAMSEKRMGANAALLPDGRILVAGGHRFLPAPVYAIQSQTYEIFDPVTGTWSAAKSLVGPRGEGAQMATLPDGQLVLLGGAGPVTHSNTAERYDAATDTWRSIGTMSSGRAVHVAIVLKDGSVLVTGGFGAGKSSERLTFVEQPVERLPDLPVEPTPTPTPSPTPTSTPQPKPAPGVAAVSVPKTLKASKAGAVSLRVRCIGQTGCTTRLALKVRGGRTLGRADVKLAAGTSKTVKLTLGRADRRRLKGRNTKVAITLGATTHSATLKLR